MVRGTEGDFAQAHPRSAELIVEVAVSSAALDRENASLYAEGEVSEYWIVLGQERRVEVYRHPHDGRYGEVSLVGPEETLSCGSIPTVRIQVSKLFA